ncbi:hypothetical protein OS189_17090 [Sulfitobacter sp. F26169L]|uniref:nucleotide-binding protein n=1 Tax=Sulfitobacter sp. F26169L TaxID=2996015 RepID=UPI0022609B02|nr:hypothetical protein [Sulfitobacter sp. F26169L]MCX7568060.1 hypothetical protein [Sulfitobacter sp. F26169L]
MTNIPTCRSTLMMTTSQKGGTGKSFLACALLDLLRTLNHPTAAYDADGTNGTLSAMHASRDDDGILLNAQDPLEGVVAYNVHNDSRTILIESGERHMGLILHDLAGGSLADLQRIFDDEEDGLHNLFTVFADLGIHPVFFHLITPDTATIQSLAFVLDMMDRLDGLAANASHIAVLNHRGLLKQADFLFWYGFEQADGQRTGGKTRDRLLAHGGVEMILPHMDERTLALVKNSTLPLSQAIHDTQFKVTDRQRIKLFIDAFAQALTPEVRDILGVQYA